MKLTNFFTNRKYIFIYNILFIFTILSIWNYDIVTLGNLFIMHI